MLEECGDLTTKLYFWPWDLNRQPSSHRHGGSAHHPCMILFTCISCKNPLLISPPHPGQTHMKLYPRHPATSPLSLTEFHGSMFTVHLWCLPLCCLHRAWLPLQLACVGGGHLPRSCRANTQLVNVGVSLQSWTPPPFVPWPFETEKVGVKVEGEGPWWIYASSGPDLFWWLSQQKIPIDPRVCLHLHLRAWPACLCQAGVQSLLSVSEPR